MHPGARPGPPTDRRSTSKETATPGLTPIADALALSPVARMRSHRSGPGTSPLRTQDRSIPLTLAAVAAIAAIGFSSGLVSGCGSASTPSAGQATTRPPGEAPAAPRGQADGAFAQGQGSKPGSTQGTVMAAADARWTPLAPSPLANQSGFSAVWTGSELLVCCGSAKDAAATGAADTMSTAAAYNPEADTWRPVDPPPAQVQSWGAINVADRTIYFLDGGTAPWTYLAYDIDASRWHPIAAPPGNDRRTATSRLGPSAWTGREIVAPILTPPASDHDLAMVAFEPATNTWRTLPSPPTRLEPTSVVYDNGRLTLLGEQRAASDQSTALVTETLDMNANTWEAPEPTPVERRGPQVVGGGEQVLAWDVSGSVRVRRGGQWQDLPSIPLPEDECGWKGIEARQLLVLWRCTQQGAVLDTSTGEWRELPKPPVELSDTNMTMLGGRLVLWAGGGEKLQPYALDLG